jgi:hypothetical protein
VGARSGAILQGITSMEKAAQVGEDRNPSHGQWQFGRLRT